MPEVNPTIVEVKHALAALAKADPEERSRIIVHEAIESTRNVERAAAFADAGGVRELERAVERAGKREPHDLLRGGQRARAAFEWFRRAAAKDDDHYHRVHGTDLTVEGKTPDR